MVHLEACGSIYHMTMITADIKAKSSQGVWRKDEWKLEKCDENFFDGINDVDNVYFF